jgi:hypothetical protein
MKKEQKSNYKSEQRIQSPMGLQNEKIVYVHHDKGDYPQHRGGSATLNLADTTREVDKIDQRNPLEEKFIKALIYFACLFLIL